MHMKRVRQSIAAILLISLSACGGPGKKVLIMASGKIEVDGTTIKLEPGTTHHEQEISVSGDKVGFHLEITQ